MYQYYSYSSYTRPRIHIIILCNFKLLYRNIYKIVYLLYTFIEKSDVLWIKLTIIKHIEVPSYTPKMLIYEQWFYIFVLYWSRHNVCLIKYILDIITKWFLVFHGTNKIIPSYKLVVSIVNAPRGYISADLFNIIYNVYPISTIYTYIGKYKIFIEISFKINNWYLYE